VKRIRADLHVHTALSPCAADEMAPHAIVAAALERDLAMIAICDHNSAGNVRAVNEAAAGTALAVVCGIEITTAEEAHVVGLFPTASAANAAGDEIRARLPETDEGYTRFFGEQWLFAGDDTIHGEETRALAMATDLPVSNVVALIKRFGGLAIAAHIDRPHFGVVGQLGFFPYDAGFDAVELSRHAPPGSDTARAARDHRLPVLHSSDAHFLDDVGGVASRLLVRDATFAELVLALRSRDDRGVADA
jgi:3',5'-nucleoside bisphosphate phosphatase